MCNCVCAHQFTSSRSLKAIKQTYIQLKASMDTKTERRTSSKPSIYKQSKNAHFTHLFSFSVSSSLVLFTDTNKCISTKNVYSKTFPQCSTRVRVMILSHRLATNESLGGGIGAQPSTSHVEFRLLIQNSNRGQSLKRVVIMIADYYESIPHRVFEISECSGNYFWHKSKNWERCFCIQATN